MLRYRHKNLTVGVMTLNPFVGKDSYRRPSETRNKYITSNSCWYIRESSRLYVATLSWNFSFGRNFKSVEKLLNNEDTKTSLYAYLPFYGESQLSSLMHRNHEDL